MNLTLPMLHTAEALGHVHHATSVFNPQSPQAQEIAQLFYIDLVVCAVILLIVATLVIVALIRFRQRPGQGEPYQDPGNPKLETLWTVVPSIVVLVLLVLTARTMHLVNPPVGHRTPNVIVTAHQWWWAYHYPQSGVITANELHMPAGTNWLLGIESADVIHSFWVPDLGAKMDAIPGHPNFLWITPHKTGVYLGTCAEYCGAEHALMGIRVVVQAPEEFAQWEREQLRMPAIPTGAEAERGAQLFAEKTCVSCHMIAGTQALGHVGPDLTHLADRDTLGSGVLANNVTNLTHWILHPQAIKPGCHMPALRFISSPVFSSFSSPLAKASSCVCNWRSR
ncbi:MAG: cytochrome c oxidase subunit II [Kiritimatiellaeota bacterium]|nr:cytochrome c oxidase subunit II [Kiritimatiellota bacterium]